jgi:hypothetical protein
MQFVGMLLLFAPVILVVGVLIHLQRQEGGEVIPPWLKDAFSGWRPERPAPPLDLSAAPEVKRDDDAPAA